MALFKKIIAQYGRPDILISPDAPAWHFAAMPIDGVGMVSGKGATIAAAHASCLGEATEIASAMRKPEDDVLPAVNPASGAWMEIEAGRVTISDLGSPDDPGSEGLGAGATDEAAQLNAVLERIERHHVAAWWTSDQPGLALPGAWCRQTGIVDLIEAARAGSTAQRRTRVLCVGQSGLVITLAAVSTMDDGTWPVLGFSSGCDPVVAARSALSELFQMELALVLARHAVSAGQAPNDPAPLVRARLLQGEKSVLLDATEEYPPETSNADLTQIVRNLGVELFLVDLSREEFGIPVFRAHSPALMSARRLKFTSPCGPV